MRVLDLFSAAAGGWSLGLHRAGFKTVAACEFVDWRRALYLMNNPSVVLYDDVRTLTADRIVSDLGYFPEAVVGSPPCQDISSANTKGKGVEGERSGLFFEAIRIIGEGRPRWFALENSANLRTRGADRVIDALEAIGYTCWPFVVSAGDIGANHERKRSWLIGFNARDAEKIGWRAWWSRRRAFAIAGLPVETCGDADEGNAADSGLAIAAGRDSPGGWCGSAEEIEGVGPVSILQQRDDADSASVGHEGWRARGYGQDGNGSPSVASGGIGNPAYPNEAGQTAGLLESSPRSTSQPGVGCGDGRFDDREGIGQVDRSTPPSPTPAEPWADWNGGLAHHLRVDDGLSGWVAQSRIAVGGPRGTAAASLIVEAFGDAVVPQIPEAIGRAILRTENAVAAIYGRAAA